MQFSRVLPLLNGFVIRTSIRDDPKSVVNTRPSLEVKQLILLKFFRSPITVNPTYGGLTPVTFGLAGVKSETGIGKVLMMSLNLLSPPYLSFKAKRGR